MSDVVINSIDFGGKPPVYATKGAAAADLFLPYDVRLYDSEWVDLRIGFDIPEGKVLLIEPRSSSLRKWMCFCDTGVIDHDYKGPIHLMLLDMRPIIRRDESNIEPIVIPRGTRLAQIMCVPVDNVITWERKTCDRDSATGSGSTGL